MYGGWDCEPACNNRAASAASKSVWGRVQEDTKEVAVDHRLATLRGSWLEKGISETLCSLWCITVDDTIDVVFKKVWATHFMKVAACNIYQALPVHLEDRWLLGRYWNDGLYTIYVNTTLLVGL